MGFCSTSFSKVTLFCLPEVFCGPQICQKCVGGVDALFFSFLVDFPTEICAGDSSLKTFAIDLKTSKHEIDVKFKK